MSGSGMDGQAGGFVHDHDVVVLEHHVDRNILRKHVGRHRVRNSDFDALVRFQSVACIGCVAINGDFAIDDESFDSSARQIATEVSKE